jgi:hypothetical protein
MLTPAGFGGGPFLQNPYYFMFASLAKTDDDTELHWMKVCLSYRFPPHPIRLFTIVRLLSSGWENAMYHGISRLVPLSPKGLGE